MTRTIPVTVEVEIDGDGCGEGCYALEPMRQIANKMYIYHRCSCHNAYLESVSIDIDEGIIYRCAECREEFGE